MFDYDEMIMYPKPKRGKRKPIRRSYRKPSKKQINYKKISQGIQVITKGYSGSAKQEYERRQKETRKKIEEAEYKRKLKRDYPTNTSKIKKKIKGFFGKKSIYK